MAAIGLKAQIEK